jgi:uncharacterized protein (TIGR02145 family)
MFWELILSIFVALTWRIFMTLKKFLTIGFVAAVLVACGDDSSSATDSDEVSSSSACEDCDGSSSSKEKSSSSSRKNGDAGTESGMTSSGAKSSSSVLSSSSKKDDAETSSSDKSSFSGKSSSLANSSSSMDVEFVETSSSSEKSSSSDGSSSSSAKLSSSSSVNSCSSEIGVSSSSAKSSSRVVSSSGVSKGYVDPLTVVKGTMTDTRDGRTYKTVKIGSQTWMAENLNYADLRPTKNEDSSSFCYNDSVSYCEKYGRLYLWSAAMDSMGTWSTNGMGCGDNRPCNPTYPVRGVCPDGWHLPDKEEWNLLIFAVGDTAAGEMPYEVAGKKLKSTSGWIDYSEKYGNGTDDYSFSVFPAGYKEGGGFYGNGYAADFWTSVSRGDIYAFTMQFPYFTHNAYYSDIDKHSTWVPVRCVKDE